jgi:hypothetical protein
MEINNEEIDKILYLKGIELTDYQREAINTICQSMIAFCNDLSQIINTIFQEKIKPIVEEIYEYVKDKPKVKMKYGFVKIIKPVEYQRINKPRFICCRSNC